MQVSADLSSKIAFLSRFEKKQLKQVRFSLIFAMTELVSIDHIGQQLEAIFLRDIVSVNINDHFSQFCFWDSFWRKCVLCLLISFHSLGLSEDTLFCHQKGRNIQEVSYGV